MRFLNYTKKVLNIYQHSELHNLDNNKENDKFIKR